jgi:diadenosine tetraphosphate (Ap4A) HIT family hydrolase
VNATLQRFGFPATVIKAYFHWVVMIRPEQITLACTVIAARSAVTRLGDLTADEAAELPRVFRDFECAVGRMAPASKFNYLALMMVDPHPHFHAIPRYATTVQVDGIAFSDAAFPQPPDLRAVHDLTADQVAGLKRRIQANWPD